MRSEHCLKPKVSAPRATRSRRQRWSPCTRRPAEHGPLSEVIDAVARPSSHVHQEMLSRRQLVMNSNRGKLDRTNSPNGIVRRVVATGLLVVVSLGAGASALRAQSTNYRAAVRPFVGAYVPTGDQRDFVKPAVLAGAQASMAFNDNFALTGSF